MISNSSKYKRSGGPWACACVSGMGRAWEGFLQSRTSELRPAYLIRFRISSDTPRDPQKCRENGQGTNSEKHPAFLKLSPCLHG